MDPTLCAIVAMDRNRAIGRKNTIPWRLKNDMKFFKETTRNSPVIMGRKTWESLPMHPLPARPCIVVSSMLRDLPFYDAVYWTDPSWYCCVDTAICKAYDTTKKAFVIGGESIYNMSIPLINTLLVTHVDAEIEGPDTFFPDVELPKTYETIARFEKSDADEYNFEIRKYTING